MNRKTLSKLQTQMQGGKLANSGPGQNLGSQMSSGLWTGSIWD